MIKIEQTNIIDLKTDAIVNAANNGLYSGSGVCRAIYLAAGPEQLTKACRQIGHCDTGKAVITDGFNLCKYIIHAVGPIYIDGKHNEEELLYSCYQEALNLAKEYNCKSIGFPLISSGIYSYPVDLAFEVAIRSIKDWLKNNEDLEIIFAVLDEDVKNIGLKLIRDNKYYLIHGKQLAKCVDNLYYLYENNEWILDNKSYVLDKLYGYDQSEPDGSPYKMFNTSIMDEIEEISEEEFNKLLNKKEDK